MDNDDNITISVDTTIDTVDTVNINDLLSGGIDISSITNGVDTITLVNTHWNDGISLDLVEFEDHMPTVAKVEDMCNDYPALEKAYENFKTIYKMVHQDWQGRQDEDDQFPF